MKNERRIDAGLAVIVDTGFELNFNKGFRIAGEYLRTHSVPPHVVARVINYGMRRPCAEPLQVIAAFLPASARLQAADSSGNAQLCTGP
jgi:hypothetical protein